MTEDETKPKEDKPGSAGPAPAESPWPGLLEKLGEKVLTAVFAAGSLVAFAAFAGSVVLWTRFDALQLPADQVVDAVPQGESAVVGATMLLIFAFLGAIAAGAIYLVDRGGRASPGLSRGLLLIVAIEAVVAIWLADDRSPAERAIAIEVVLLFLGAILWATHVGGLIRLDEDELQDHEGREKPQIPLKTVFGSDEPGKFGVDRADVVKALAAALAGGALVALVVLLVSGSASSAWIVSLAAVGLILVVAIARRWVGFNVREAEERRRERKGREERERREREAEEKKCPDARHKPGAKRKPPAFELTPMGSLVAGLLAVAAIAIPAAILWELWVVAALAAVMAIGLGLWRIADLSKERFLWFGLAVFLSVPLFGTVTLVARNLEDPQVQPLALIRDTDGGAEALQGFYVTETETRVYFANVATRDCGKEVIEDSGRLLWVPKSEVVAMSVGPLQDVNHAGRAALEMAYALTPDIETSSGERVSLRVEGEEAEPDAEDKEAGPDHRLETAGPAVRPVFGHGLRLDPEVAIPGQEVTLTMSQSEGDEGFGEKRELRLNGIELPVQSWGPRTIVFSVPENATSGPVTVECEPLAGEPFLTVSRKPTARISMKMQPGSNRVSLDSRRSSDEGEIKSREWTVSGLSRGSGKQRITRSLPPRTGAYRIQLTVTDDEGETDTAEARLLRLRVSHFHFGEDTPESRRVVNEVRRAVSRAAEKWNPPAGIEIDGHADDVGTPRYNARLSWRRAAALKSALRSTKLDAIWDEADPQPRLIVRAFGETCPLKPGAGRLRENRRVEVFIFTRGARLLVPHTCHAVYVKRANW